MNDKACVLIADDEPFYLDLLYELLSTEYRVIVAKNGQQALKRARAGNPPELILLDIMMPEMDGYQVCRRLKADPTTSHIPVVFLTGKSGAEDETRGLELGAVDYVSKPISPPVLLARVRNHLALSQQRIALEHLVSERTEQIVKAKDAVTYSMAALAEARDNETGNHLRRTQHYIRLICGELVDKGTFSPALNTRTAELIIRAAPLHDIGKVGVADSILRKPGKLSPVEWMEMKQHTRYGRDALLQAEKGIGQTPYLETAKLIAFAHHERWDGSGYPQGLKEEEIPLAARLMAVADVYDALISWRPYMPACDHAEAVSRIREESGSHFDPRVVEAFLSVEGEIHKVANRLADNG